MGGKLGLDPNSSEGDDGAAGDPDEDALSNLDEYLLHGDPQDADSIHGGFPDGLQLGLLGHWKLDETDGTTAVDSSLNMHHGTLQGTPAWNPTTGIYDGALAFMSSVDRIDLPSHMLDGVGDVTFSCWFRTEYDGMQSLLSGANTGNPNELLVYYQDATTLIVATGGSPPGSLQWTVPRIDDGMWHHLVIKRNDSADWVTCYFDGVVVGSAPKAMVALDIDVGGLIIGQEQDSVGGGFQETQRFRGDLDDMRMYSRILTTPEVETLYNVDRDTDGMPDWWEIKYELDPYDASGDNGATGDPDGDGVDNLTEFLQGRSPAAGVDENASGTVELVVFTP